MQRAYFMLLDNKLSCVMLGWLWCGQLKKQTQNWIFPLLNNTTTQPYLHTEEKLLMLKKNGKQNFYSFLNATLFISLGGNFDMTYHHHLNIPYLKKMQKVGGMSDVAMRKIFFIWRQQMNSLLIWLFR